jgi:hypothetical protein
MENQDNQNRPDDVAPAAPTCSPQVGQIRLQGKRGPASKITVAMVELCQRLIGIAHKHQIVKLLQAESQKINGTALSRVLVERIFTKARAAIRAERAIDSIDSKNAALALYESIAFSQKVSPKEKIRAQERIDAILGHDAKFSALNGPAVGDRGGGVQRPGAVEPDLDSPMVPPATVAPSDPGQSVEQPGALQDSGGGAAQR